MKSPTYQRIHESAEEIVRAVRLSVLSSLRSFYGCSFHLQDLTDSEMGILAELVKLKLSYEEERALLVTQDRHKIVVDLVEIPGVNRAQIPTQRASG